MLEPSPRAKPRLLFPNESPLAEKPRWSGGRGQAAAPRLSLVMHLGWERSSLRAEMRAERRGGWRERSPALLLVCGPPMKSLGVEAAQRQLLCPFKAAFSTKLGS